ncbi:hypothetical protein C6N67_04175 [Weissella cibaria]|nr:hypothetical protein C6N67_04175 [Weissella cibaria]
MNILWDLIRSFGVGVSAYIFSRDWIMLGDYPPTMNTSGINWWLDGVALLFWLITFVVLNMYGIKKAY